MFSQFFNRLRSRKGNVAQVDLDRWAQSAYRIHAYLARQRETLRNVNAPANLQKQMAVAERLNQSLFRGIVRSGGTDPHQQACNALRQSLSEAGYNRTIPDETSYPPLDTQTSRCFAEAIRAAADARRELERERGCYDGMAEQLEEWATSAECELIFVSGPVSLKDAVPQPSRGNASGLHTRASAI